jgi:hypothetical protein
MGLREFWNRLTGGDKLEQVEEELEEDMVEEPKPVEDYQGLKDDQFIDQLGRGPETIGEDDR